MRLIDADALIQNHFSDEHRIALSYADKLWMRRIINNEPTIDAVPVVRCKDCKHSVKYNCKNDACYSFTICRRRDGYAEDVEEDDFCSYGERKEQNNV